MSDESFDRIVSQALHRAAVAGPCPDAAQLAAFHDGTLSRQERVELERHASDCARCSAQLAVLARLAELDGPRSPHRGILAWHWRWLVPVATAVVVFAVLSDTGERTPAPVTQRSEAPAEQRATAPPASTGREYDQLVGPADGGRKQESADEQKRRGANAVARSTANTSPSQDKVAPPAPPPSPASPAPVLERQNLGQAGGSVPAAAPAPAIERASPEKSREEYEARVLEDTAQAPKALPETVAPPERRGPADKESTDQRAAARADSFREKSAALSAAAKTAPLVVRINESVLVRADGARLERSLDGGATWRSEYADAPAGLLVGTCPSVETCWFGGEAGQVLHREPSGNWTRATVSDSIVIVRIDANDALRATVTARDGRRFATIDGGRSWTRVN